MPGQYGVSKVRDLVKTVFALQDLTGFTAPGVI